MSDKKCENCKYYESVSSEYQEIQKGICLRFPPTVLIGPYNSGSSFDIIQKSPEVYSDSWCGEFKAK